MKLRTAFVYDTRTGLFTGRTFTSDAEHLDRYASGNLRAFEAFIVDVTDPLSRRVDIDTGQVIDYQPPQPDEDHEWDGKQWKLTDAAQTRIIADASARANIQLQEAGSLRAIRELLLNPKDDEARAKLQAADDAIASERPKIAEKGDVRGGT